LADQAIGRLRNIPGVQRVSAAENVPFANGTSSSPIQVEATAGDPALVTREAQQRYVMPGYFDTMGIRLVAGRAFDATDRAGSEPVAIVTVSEMRRDFGGRNPLGLRIRHQSVWRRIVGVAADVKFRGLAKEDEPTIYVPAAQFGLGWPTFVVRGSAPATIEPAFKAILRELEPRASLLETASLPVLIEKSYAAERYRTVIVSVFGVMALLLAAVGLYGVSVRAAARRNREIGIRLALGSTTGRVVRLLVADAMGGVAVGLVVGVPAALIAGRLVRPYLFGVTPNDPVSFVAVGAVLIVVTAAASLIPAHGAGKTSPAVVLRAE
jgi:hypothetical protein